MIHLLYTPDILLALSIAPILFISRTYRIIPIIAAPIIALAVLWRLPLGWQVQSDWYHFTVTWFRLDIIGRFMASIYLFVVMVAGIFALKIIRKKEIFTAYLYGAAAVATVLAGDLIALIIAWELLAITSLCLLWFSGERRSQGAAMRYAIWHFFGGVMLLSGIAWQVADIGSIGFDAISLNNPAGWLILAGIWLNTGMFPFTSWVADAYPKSSPAAAVFLSSFTTKTAIIIMLRIFAGEEILLYPALITIIIGGIYSLFEDDMRRLLCWAILIQVGFMITAVSVGGDFAYTAVPAMAAVDILYKVPLFMAAGIVLHYTGKNRLSQMGGLIDNMPWVFTLAIIAGLTSMAMPFTAGFMAKTWLMESIDLNHGYLGWSALTIMSGFAVLPTSLWFVRWVFGPNIVQEQDPRTPNPFSQSAMLLAVMACLILAVPAVWNILLNVAHPAEIWNIKEILHAFQLVFATLGIGFLLMIWIEPKDSYSVGIDWLWREAIVQYWPRFERLLARLQKGFDHLKVHLRRIFNRLYAFISSPRSPLLRSKSVSNQSFEVSIFLTFFIVIWMFFS
ncbi:MAG: proton-conducting transporter membrane subunit [Alphaproteobacteria bacterium]